MNKFLLLALILCISMTKALAQKTYFDIAPIDLNQTLDLSKKRQVIQLPGQDQMVVPILNNMMDDELKKRFPEVHSYDLFDAFGEKVGYLITTPQTISYGLWNEEKMTSFYPDHKGGYILEKGILDEWICDTKEKKYFSLFEKRSTVGKYTYGDDLQSFKLAIITTGEFYEQHGNDDNVVLGEIVKTLSGVNRIFERDFAINFTLTGRVKMFSDKNTDPFTPVINGGGSSRTIQSARAFNDEFDVSDYDLGITFNAFAEGWPGGGLAINQAACSPEVNSSGPTKARVWAASAGEANNAFTVLVCHEIGHAFGARHTMNSGAELCADAVSEDNAYEIGSGNTIMSYGGYCGDGTDYIEPAEIINNYFHFSSLLLMSQYIETLDCQIELSTINTPPDLTINPCEMANFQIPLSTPFSITAVGSDPEGDDLTYVWEQLDEDGPGSPNLGFLGSEAANSNKGPLFRGYGPSSNPRRDFPRFFSFFSQDPFETLPAVPRDLTLRCTVRDNNPEGGIFTSDEVVVSVLDAGPFQVQIDSFIDTIVGGETINVTWSDNGVSGICDQVDVSLISLEDPNFIIPVATNVPFGELGVQYFIPPGFSIEGDLHFRVECHQSECFSFYNYSPPFFSTTNCPSPELYFACGLDDVTANIGAEELNQTGVKGFSAEETHVEEVVISNEDNLVQFVRLTLSEECEELIFPSGNPVLAFYEYKSFRVATDGWYRIRNNTPDFAGFLLFEENGFDENNLCASLIASSMTESLNSPGTTNTSFKEWIDVELESCVEYRLAVVEFGPGAYPMTISGDGLLSLEQGSDLDESYFYVVEDGEGKIEEILSVSDFRALRQGSKNVYTIQVDTEVFDPAVFKGKVLADLGVEGVCVDRSLNTADFLLINPLPDEDQDGYHTDEDCDDNDPNVNPGQIEIRNNAIDENCDGIIEGDDNDNDGFVVGVDCDDNNPAINPEAEEILNNDVDEDCDGVANVIDEDMDGFNSDEDCDDQNAAINPGAEEIPNNDIDENCDGETLVIDEDMDGFNSDEDCDDSNASVNPGAAEIPNNDVDENCDGEILVIDEDMDGFNSDEDCDDTNPAINPNAEEIPENAIDENCDGIVLNFDADMDGFNSEDDCDDSDPAINPEAEEIPNNDIDENCDGELLIIDEDQDGFNSDEDCNDQDASINPGAEEIPNNDVDENCDGAVIVIDADMDGFNSTEDCDDSNAAINPEAEEIPNNDIDEDCDGEALVIDEDMDGFNSDEDCNDQDASINPEAEEIPNNDVDENCNGELGFTDDDMDGFNGSVDCNDQDASINPGAEEIPNNGIDEDCDGMDATSATDEEVGSLITLAPNPTSNHVFISGAQIGSKVHVLSTTGEVLDVVTIRYDHHPVDLMKYPSGLYLLVFLDRTMNTVEVKKVIKI